MVKWNGDAEELERSGIRSAGERMILAELGQGFRVPAAWYHPDVVCAGDA
jgi:hypothetical protein